MRYQVTVENLGNVCDTMDVAKAMREVSAYAAYCREGHRGGFPVVLWADGEPLMEVQS